MPKPTNRTPVGQLGSSLSQGKISIPICFTQHFCTGGIWFNLVMKCILLFYQGFLQSIFTTWIIFIVNDHGIIRHGINVEGVGEWGGAVLSYCPLQLNIQLPRLTWLVGLHSQKYCASSTERNGIQEPAPLPMQWALRSCCDLSQQRMLPASFSLLVFPEIATKTVVLTGQKAGPEFYLQIIVLQSGRSESAPAQYKHISEVS